MNLSFIIWNVDPVIFKIGIFSLHWYSLFLFLGFYVSYLFLTKIFKDEGYSRQTLDSYAIFIILGILIGGRLMHCLVYEPEHYLRYPLDIIKPWRGVLGKGAVFTGIRGLSGHGSAIGVVIGVAINAFRTKTPVSWIIDRIALFGPLVGFFVRMGNLMNSEILGKHSDKPWAFIFKRVSKVPRHPAQLYEAITYLIIFGIVFLYFKKHQGKEKPLSILGLVIFFLYLSRFFIEFVKSPQTKIEKDMLINYGQLLSLPFIIVGLILFFRPWKKIKNNYA